MKDALFHLNPLDGVGLQAQVREMLVSAILSRRLTPGEAVPSSRSMATQLGVSRNTVTLAYQALVADGYLEGRDRSGYFVGTHAPAGEVGVAEAVEDDSVVDWAARMGAWAPGGPRIEKPLNWREYRFPFVYGQADPKLFNHSDWRDCARQALGLRNFEAMAGDKGRADDPLLVDYIRARSLPRRGVMARTEQILVTLGAQNALYLIAQLLCTRGARVMIEDPTYPDLRDTLLSLGADVSVLPVDEHGMPVDERLAEADVVFVTPSHHAPTTATMPLERRRALLAAAEKYDFIIVEDDYDFEMGFLQTPAPALKSLDPHGRVIYVGSFSKSLFPGLRLGYLVAPEPVIWQARELRALILRHLPGHTQRTAAYFLALGHHDALIRRLRSAFAERRTAMQDALEAAGLGGARAPRFGGASFWTAAPPDIDTAILAERLRERSVLIEPGAPFFADRSLSGCARPANYMRLAYSSIESEKIHEGIGIIADEIARMTRERP
jgi:GntR family transcriptional regulator/MocR family aminotransferase